MSAATAPRFGRMIPAMVTPFDENVDLDLKQARALARRLVENGADALIINGTTGESPTVFYPQKMKLFEAVVSEIDGEVPVIANVGDNCTADTVDFARDVQKLGVDGFMLVVPYYNKPPQEGLYQHFKTIAGSIDLPCILYNIPGRTGCSISPANVERLSRHPNAWGIKEASGNISYAADIAHCLSDDFHMMSGNDDMVVPLMSLGAVGVISVWADVAPGTVHDMCASFLAGDVEAARRAQIDNLELIHSLFCEVNPIPVKAALAKMGLLEENYRKPLWPMAGANRERLYAAMRGAGLIG